MSQNDQELVSADRKAAAKSKQSISIAAQLEPAGRFATALQSVQQWRIRYDRYQAQIGFKRRWLTCLTCHEEFPPVEARVRPEKGTDDEAIKIFRRADHRDFAGA